MILKTLYNLQWVPFYIIDRLKKFFPKKNPEHIYFCICDHFEPYWNQADKRKARYRLMRWIDDYPKIADQHHDSDGLPLRYSFFYPEEQYQEDDLDKMGELCRSGYGEVEVHLHHHNDSSENLRKTLLEYKKRLHGDHGLLSVDRETGEIAYGFIHGNWALDNARPDRSWCGVNNELTILQQTGCYADFTMPSAPDPTQTKKINSIYYAVDNPKKVKSHNTGMDAQVGRNGAGLLMVQGPLLLSWRDLKWGFIPKIENSGLLGNHPADAHRITKWINAGVHVKRASENLFIKIYTHGAQESCMQMLFDDSGLATLFNQLRERSNFMNAQLHYVSAREMVNIIHAILKGENISIGSRNSRYIMLSD